MNEAAITLDGWYVLHDLRSMDWASWKLISKEERQAAIEEFMAYLDKLQQADDAKTGSHAFLHGRRAEGGFHAHDIASDNRRTAGARSGIQ